MATQIGKTIEQTIGASLQAVNQFLVTGKFNAQALLQQILTLGLQLVEQMIIQRIMAAINHEAAVAQAAITGPQISAAMAPAATAATIATEGQAALTAPASVAAALFAIEGLLVAHEGGAIGRGRKRRFHGGGLAADEVPIIAQEGEIMIQRSVAQRPGMANFLLGLNESHRGGLIPRLHGGGSLGSGSASGAFGGGVHIYAFTDLKALTKHMASREGQKIIFDTVKGRRIDLGIG
jgi:hypothetical protein